MAIGAARKEARLRGDELADAVGVSRATLSTWENGKVVPDAYYLARVVRILDISFDELVLGREAVMARWTATPPESAAAPRGSHWLPTGGSRNLQELVARMIDEQERQANEVDRLKRELREAGVLPAPAPLTRRATGTA